MVDEMYSAAEEAYLFEENRGNEGKGIEEAFKIESGSENIKTCPDCGNEVPEDIMEYCSDCGMDVCDDCFGDVYCRECEEIREEEDSI